MPRRVHHGLPRRRARARCSWSSSAHVATDPHDSRSARLARCSTSAAAPSSASPRSRSACTGARPNSQPRSSRSCRRARPTTHAGRRPGAGSCASVCSTESCRCAAISARSSDRMRSLRSSTSAFHSRQSHGPKIRRQAAEHHGHRQQSLADGVRTRPAWRGTRPTPLDDERAADDDPDDRRGVASRSGRVAAVRAALAPDELADELVDRPTAAADDQRGAHGREHDRPQRPRRGTRARSTATTAARPSATAPSAATCTESSRERSPPTTVTGRERRPSAREEEPARGVQRRRRRRRRRRAR